MFHTTLRGLFSSVGDHCAYCLEGVFPLSAAACFARFSGALHWNSSSFLRALTGIVA